MQKEIINTTTREAIARELITISQETSCLRKKQMT